MEKQRQVVALATACLIAVSLGACQVSIQSVPDGDAVAVAEFVGDWSDGDAISLECTDNSDGTASVTIEQEGETFHAIGRVMDVGEDRLAILSHDNWQHIMFSKVALNNDSINVWMPDEQVMRSAVISDTLDGRILSMPDGSLSTTVVEASPEDLAQFIRSNEDLFPDDPTFVLARNSSQMAAGADDLVGRGPWVAIASIGLAAILAAIVLLRRQSRG